MMGTNIKERTLEFIKYKGITMKTFETKCGLSSGYVTSMRKGFGSDKLNNVLTAFPELNRDWLLYGEGDMLRSPSSSLFMVQGGGSVGVSGGVNGHHNTVGGTASSDENVRLALSEVAEQRKLVSKAQEQVDRLLSIIERMQGGSSQ